MWNQIPSARKGSWGKKWILLIGCCFLGLTLAFCGVGRLETDGPTGGGEGGSPEAGQHQGDGHISTDPEQSTNPDGGHQNPPDTTTQPDPTGQPDKHIPSPDQNTGTDQTQPLDNRTAPEQTQPETAANPDTKTNDSSDPSKIVPNPPSAFPPKGAFQPTIHQFSAFWRFLPGSVYRPIVLNAKIELKNTGKQGLSDITIKAKLYYETKVQTKLLELPNAKPAIPNPLQAGKSMIITFNGFTVDHGLPPYNERSKVCKKLYIPVYHFNYKEGGQAKSFRMLGKGVPFGCP